MDRRLRIYEKFDNASFLDDALFEKIYKNMKINLLAVLVFALFMLGCVSTETVESTKVSPADIYQEYSISASKNRTGITATFRLNKSTGTTVDLDAPAKVEYNGKEMSETAPSFMKGTDYHGYSNRFESLHQFVYTDAAGKTYHNEIYFEPLEIQGNSFSLNPSAINKIPLSRVVGENETVYVSLSSEFPPPRSDPNANANVDFNSMPLHTFNKPIKLDQTRSALLIEPSDLRKFVPGRASLRLEVQKEESLKEATKVGGRIVFDYKSEIANANVLN